MAFFLFYFFLSIPSFRTEKNKGPLKPPFVLFSCVAPTVCILLTEYGKWIRLCLSGRNLSPIWHISGLEFTASIKAEQKSAETRNFNQRGESLNTISRLPPRGEKRWRNALVKQKGEGRGRVVRVAGRGRPGPAWAAPRQRPGQRLPHGPRPARLASRRAARWHRRAGNRPGRVLRAPSAPTRECPPGNGGPSPGVPARECWP